MGTTDSNVVAVAKRFADTLNGVAEDPNFVDLFAETIVTFRCYDEAPMDVPGAMISNALLQETKLLPQAMADYHVENVQLRVLDDAFVLTRTQVGSLPDGTRLQLSQVLINVVEDGLIVRSEAYYDRACAAPIHEWLAKKLEAGEITFEVGSAFTGTSD